MNRNDNNNNIFMRKFIYSPETKCQETWFYFDQISLMCINKINRDIFKNKLTKKQIDNVWRKHMRHSDLKFVWQPVRNKILAINVCTKIRSLFYLGIKSKVNHPWICTYPPAPRYVHFGTQFEYQKIPANNLNFI